MKAAETTARVDGIENQNAKSVKCIKSLESTIASLRKKIDEQNAERDLHDKSTARTLADFAETSTRLRHIRVSGIPARKDEKLVDIVAKLFQLIGLPPLDNIRFHRLKSGSSAETIIIVCPTVNDKEICLARFQQARDKLLVSAILPREKENNIFVTQDLCQTQYKIAREALKMKGSIVKKHRILHGYVNIQLEEDKPFIRILSLEMLKSITEAAS